MKLKSHASIVKIKTFNLNFGPQHPAAHGVLRLVLQLNGELIIEATPHIGLLHRGTEKLIEHKLFLQSLPYFDRLDYVSMLTSEHGYTLTLEAGLNCNLPVRAQFIRVLLDEITRILNHIMAITTHAMDVGALTPFLWAFEEREKLMEFYERFSGARMHATYYRPGGIAFDLPKKLIYDINYFLSRFASRVNEIEELLTANRIWKMRLKNIGLITKKEGLSWGQSGVLLRGAGVNMDLRKKSPYATYRQTKWNIAVTQKGDCFDRYIIRLNELRQSSYIMAQAINYLPEGAYKLMDTKITSTTRGKMKHTMENTISHFKNIVSGFCIPLADIFSSLEAPKGEFGLYLVAQQYNNKAYRCKIKGPGFLNLQTINIMAQMHFLADVVTIIGTQDIVFGEVDR